MPFRIRVEARNWFRDLMKNGFDIDFEPFYFCFIAGITEGRKADPANSETAELVDYFPGRFKGRGKILVALFLSKELKELGVTINEKKAVHSEISKLINPESQNYLSDEGIREFNKYAHGGYDVLLDWFGDRPRTLDNFLRVFRGKIKEYHTGLS